MHRRDGYQLFSRIATGDESWVHHSTPETKRQSMVWKKPEESASKKAKVTISAGKVMAIVFWDCKGVLLVDYLPPNTTVNAARYCEVLTKLRAAIKSKRPGLLSRKVLLVHDNARPHAARTTQTLLENFKWKIFTHPPYSPDLAPSDFHLFPALKLHLGGKHFANDEEVQAEANHWLRRQDTAWYNSGIKKLLQRYQKCSDRNGTKEKKEALKVYLENSVVAGIPQMVSVSSLPAPPMMYAHLYTDENIERGLVPPPPAPLMEPCSSFGITLKLDDKILPSLEDQEFRRIYSLKRSYKKELKKLNISICTNYLELLDILVQCPDSPNKLEKLENIKLLFVNMHHLVNEMRVHQALEAIRIKLILQKQENDKVIANLQKVIDKMKESLSNVIFRNLNSPKNQDYVLQSFAEYPVIAVKKYKPVELNGGLQSRVEHPITSNKQYEPVELNDLFQSRAQPPVTAIKKHESVELKDKILCAMID
ncbi:hypothetical protein LAZ67_2000896 [Cordylochernes scorpioides]|uniref:Mediator of RNA polymerase II transcription subunit 7 n=1 Tax=Cordylochernes scorpioides TaxID=51811 RepID=A0ABY6K128_9ARAC|nr:hypothetical protein LAZ67_2000896 [Cordylochernes scorpioides]